MNKNFLRMAFLLVFILAGNAFSQWTAKGSFPDTTNDALWQSGNVHGLAVDPDGKIWAQNYYALTRDSMLVPTATGNVYKAVRALYVYNPDGSLYDFPTTNGVKQQNPIKVYIDNSGITGDTLGGVYPWASANLNTGRGMRADKDGNIVAAYFNILYKFDYKTGLGLGRATHLTATGGAASLTAPAFATNTNHMFSATVAPGNPVREYDANMSEVAISIPASVGFSRAFEVSPDGNTIYWAGYTNKAIYVYHRADEFSSFDSVGVIAKGFHMESCAWDPIHPSWLWMSAGGSDEPNGYTEPDLTPVNTYYRRMVWYAWDVTDNTIKDSLEWLTPVDVMNQKPRGIAFTADGNTAYVSVFGWGYKDAIQKFTRATAPTTVEFKCNMSVQMKRGTFKATDSVWVRGNFNDWAGKATQLTDPDGDSVYTGVFSTFTTGQSLVFKYVHSPDVWESTGNRTLTVAAGANVTSACWEDVCVYVPVKTIKVAFSVNMELERLSGLFNPASNNVSVRGSFNGWGETAMTPSATNADLYEVVADVIASVDEKVSFKFFYSPGTWEVNNLDGPSQNDRFFIVDQATFDAGTKEYAAVGFNNGSLETVLNQDAYITFTCNTNNASIVNAPQGTAFTTVHMAGGNSPLQWPGGGWPDADITKVIQLYDDGTHKDAVAGDKIFTTEIKFPQYATLNVVYKYGANWGLPTNGGANDNEAGVGADKTLKMHKLTAQAVVVDTFGVVHTTVLTKVEKEGNEIPTVFALSQNYPNPFNPETNIRFSVPQESFVTVKVFNTLGEEVMTLVNEEKTAGTYNVSFNAKNLTSGIYFYTIKANDFTSTKKMILMK